MSRNSTIDRAAVGFVALYAAFLGMAAGVWIKSKAIERDELARRVRALERLAAPDGEPEALKPMPVRIVRD